MSDGAHLSRVFDSEALGLAAFVACSQLPLPLQLPLQAPAGLHHVPHLPLPVHPEALDLLPQVALGFDGLAEAAFLCHLHKFQFLHKYFAAVGPTPTWLGAHGGASDAGVLPAEGCAWPARQPPASPPASPSS